jgi:hypothetical protein
MTTNTVNTNKAKALLALSAANIATELWRWESPLMGGATEAVAVYPAIDWVNELSSDELARLIPELQALGIALSASGVAALQASDEEILVALAGINPTKQKEIISRQVRDWNSKALQALASFGDLDQLIADKKAENRAAELAALAERNASREAYKALAKKHESLYKEYCSFVQTLAKKPRKVGSDMGAICRSKFEELGLKDSHFAWQAEPRKAKLISRNEANAA